MRYEKAIELLKDDPEAHFLTLCAMFGPEVVSSVPPCGISPLIKAFEEAGAKIGRKADAEKVINFLKQKRECHSVVEKGPDGKKFIY